MRILIAEDDSVLRRILEFTLINWGYQVTATSNGQEAWQALQAENAPQLAIIDRLMPGMDGIEVCRKVREAGKDRYTYIILCTALDKEEDLVAGLDAGADDYIAKPFKTTELQARLQAGRWIIELQSEMITARDALREKATHDSLTGLWNHDEILIILEHELNRAEREGLSVGVILTDLDHFKKINDTFGHLAGDAVLRMAAGKMLAAVRSYDAIGRFGGEEFLIVLPGCDTMSAAAFAERLRLRIGEAAMDTQQGMIQVTISLGVAVSGIGKKLNAISIFQAADQALYLAKEKGRNRVEVACDTIIRNSVPPPFAGD